MKNRMMNHIPAGEPYIGNEQLINYLMLYDSGDECEEVTGGVQQSFQRTSGVGSITKNEDHIRVYAPNKNSSENIASTQKAIDVTSYNRMYAYAEIKSVSSNVKIGLTTNIVDSLVEYENTPSAIWSAGIYYTNGMSLTPAEIIKLDIESLSGERYLTIGANGSSSYSTSSEAYIRNLFLTKADDYTTLCSKADLSAPSTLDALLADTTSLAIIFNNEDAVKFMVAQCTGDFMVSVLSNEAAVEVLKASPYLNLVVANVHWAKFAMMIPNAKELLGFTMLYDHGDECTDVTGGWSSSGWSAKNGTTTASVTSATKNNNSITTAGLSSGFNLLATATNINIDGYAHLHAYVNAISVGSNASGILGLNTDKSIEDGCSLQTVLRTVGKQILSIEVNGGNYYVVLFASNYTTRKTEWYNVFLTKSDNWQEWMAKGGLVGATDLDSLLADSTAMEQIMANEQAVKYLVGCTGDLMVSILNNLTAIAAIVNSAIATQYLTSHPAWKKFIAMMPVCIDAGLDLMV